MVKIELMKRDFVWIGLLIVFLGAGFTYGFGGSDPTIMGHSGGEIAVDDALCIQVTGHECGYDSDAASICPDDKYLKGDGSCYSVLDWNGTEPEPIECPCGECGDTRMVEICPGCFEIQTCVESGWGTTTPAPAGCCTEQ